jgi:hypothetical protein
MKITKSKKSWNSTPMSFCPSIVTADDLTYYSPTSIFHILVIKKTVDLDQSRVYWRFAVGTKNFSNLKWSLTTFFELEQNVEKGKWKKNYHQSSVFEKKHLQIRLKILSLFFFFFFFFEIIIVSTKLLLDVWETENKVTRSWMGQHLEKELTSLFETV